MKTHTLSPALNAAIDNVRNAAWKQRDLNVARAQLEETITKALDAARDEGRALLKGDMLRAPGRTDLLSWLLDQITICTSEATREQHEQDRADWLSDADYLRECYRIISTKSETT